VVNKYQSCDENLLSFHGAVVVIATTSLGWYLAAEGELWLEDSVTLDGS
jgi:hypothetical protein